MTAIIVLGAAVWEDGPSPALSRRARHAAKLFHENKGEIVLGCGGLGRFPPTEAVVIQTLLEDARVPRDAILLEPLSTTTYENLRNAAQILGPLGIRNTTIVTDRFHGPRAKMTALACGLRAKIDTPAPETVARAITIRRVAREAIGLPTYAICLGWWRWRDRQR